MNIILHILDTNNITPRITKTIKESKTEGFYNLTTAYHIDRADTLDGLDLVILHNVLYSGTKAVAEDYTIVSGRWGVQHNVTDIIGEMLKYV